MRRNSFVQMALTGRIGVRLSGGGAACTPTDQIDGNVTAGSTFTHEADGVIAWTQTTRASGDATRIRIRYQDANNYWYVAVDQPGALALLESVAGVITSRASAAAVVSSGHRVVVVCEGATIRGYSNGTLRWTYSSASNFATETDGSVWTLGTGGAIADLKTWSLVCSAEEGV